MRSSNFEHVGDFQREVLGNEFPKEPCLPKDLAYSVQCLEEEVAEFAVAAANNDLPGAVDALVDLVYFALGISYQMGADFDHAFMLVHMANLKKRRGVTKRGYDGEAGDAVKPDNWKDPKEAIHAMLFPPKH